MIRRAIEALFVALFLEAHKTPPKRIILDLDATDDPLHGHQEGRFFHGYYDCYCYLPLYVFCGRHLLAARLRRSNIDASAGAKDEVKRIVAQIRARWPKVRSCAGRFRLCPRRAHGVVRSQWHRLRLRARPQRAAGRRDRRRPGRGRAGELGKGRSRTSLRRLRLAHARQLEPDAPGRRQGRAPAQGREPTLCGHLAAGRHGRCPHSVRGGVLRPRRCGEPHQRAAARPVRRSHVSSHHEGQSAAALVASFAYVLLDALRRIGLRHTQFSAATCGTIRLKLLKIGAQVRISVRRIKVAMASAFPCQAEYHLAYLYLQRAAF